MKTTPTEQKTVLIVDDTPANLSVLLDTLSRQGIKVLVARSGQRALEQVKHARPDLILLDVVMPDLDGFETCRRFKANPDTREIPIIFMTSLSETTDKIRGFEAGAVDYVTKPFQHEEVLARVTTHLTLRDLQHALREANNHLEKRVAERTAALQEALEEVEQLKSRLQAENLYLQEEIRGAHNFEEIIGSSPALLALQQTLERVAPTDSTVLIQGETGTGKELVARAVHALSGRKTRPLVKVNCAAIPSGLVESELFGHAKGAFTGALQKRVGRFEVAHGGTLFLDEIAELPLDMQAKLLRALQEKEFEPLGSNRTLQADVRVIAATNRNLDEEVKGGRFRSDLFYRLAVVPIEVVPLRERREDIKSLTMYFLSRYAKQFGRRLESVSQETMSILANYAWPGNVRELQNVIERAVVLTEGPVLRLGSNLLPVSQEERLARPGEALTGRASSSAPVDRSTFLSLDESQKQHILQALQRTGGVIDGPRGAARMLGLHANTLRSRMKKFGINP